MIRASIGVQYVRIMGDNFNFTLALKSGQVYTYSFILIVFIVQK